MKSFIQFLAESIKWTVKNNEADIDNMEVKKDLGHYTLIFLNLESFSSNIFNFLNIKSLPKSIIPQKKIKGNPFIYRNYYRML